MYEDKVSEETLQEARRDEQEFRHLIPNTGFIGNYMQYTDKQESPGSYHFWVAMGILGSIIQRRAWISKGMYNIYPSMYIVLVAPSGKCRKSRAISMGIDLIKDFDFVNIIADKTSPEALLEALQSGTGNMINSQKGKGTNTSVNLNLDNSGIIKATELQVFMSKQTYNADMIGLLTDLFDCPDSFRYVTRNRKPIELQNVSITFLGASTPKWLATSLPDGAFEGGFMSRVIFVVKQVRDRRITFPLEPFPAEKQEIKNKLIRIRNIVTGKVPLRSDARQWFEDWYTSGEADMTQDEELSGFVERKPDTVLKMALLLAASDENKDITLNNIIQAKNILEWTQDRMFQAFEHIELSVLGKIRRRIYETIEINGVTSRRDLMRKIGGRLPTIKVLEEAELIMQEAGDIVIAWYRKGGMSGKGKWSKVYIDEKRYKDYKNNKDYVFSEQKPSGVIVKDKKDDSN